MSETEYKIYVLLLKHLYPRQVATVLKVSPKTVSQISAELVRKKHLRRTSDRPAFYVQGKVPLTEPYGGVIKGNIDPPAPREFLLRRTGPVRAHHTSRTFPMRGPPMLSLESIPWTRTWRAGGVAFHLLDGPPCPGGHKVEYIDGPKEGTLKVQLAEAHIEGREAIGYYGHVVADEAIKVAGWFAHATGATLGRQKVGYATEYGLPVAGEVGAELASLQALGVLSELVWVDQSCGPGRYEVETRDPWLMVLLWESSVLERGGDGKP